MMYDDRFREAVVVSLEASVWQNDVVGLHARGELQPCSHFRRHDYEMY